jgi:bifunctional NMN adenylyltransferase/nudix hydrolase
MKKYHTLVMIGRFQPVHSAHQEIIRRATTLAQQVVIIVGSAKQPRTFKNPWSSHERRLMLQNVVDSIHTDAVVRIDENIDTIYNDQAWAGRIQQIVSKYTTVADKIGIIGHKKDESSFYLDMFPQWAFEDVPLLEPLHASNVRDLYFQENANLKFLQGVLPQPVMRMLEGWIGTPEYNQVVRERLFVEKYRQQYASLPYEPTFVTADALVVCAGHVLLVKRKSEPGRGLLALPGGYLNAKTDKSMKDCMIRELREETGIKVPAPVLRGSIVSSRVFDGLERSARGRIITHAFRVDLPDTELPRVKGADDAEKAFWMPIGSLDSSDFFEDHFEIIMSML